MPRICSGLDKFNFYIIRRKITEIFKETHIKIFIHIREGEINLNDNNSTIAQIDEEECDSYQTTYQIQTTKMRLIT